MSEKHYISENAQLMAEWDWEKNNPLGLSPNELVMGCGKKAWWKCASGHEWQASIANRAIRNTGCPYCSGRKAISGINDLETLHPDIAKEWNTEKNGDLLPSIVSPGSGKKVWWKCDVGHEWITAIEKRVKEKTGCPYCSGHKVVSRINDLETLYPDIAKEWNTEKNGDLLPTMVSPGSRKKVWWRCALGHEWEAEIVNRTTGKTGCPYCAGKKVLSGFNDLLTLNPNLAAEWDVQKNGILSPTMVSLHSGKIVWWKCTNGHEWQETIANRVNERGCPYCSDHKVISGINDLETLYPNIAKEWNTEKNGDLSPSMVSSGSGKKVWWICRKGHEWQAVINSRTLQHTGCPVCRLEQQTSFPEQAILFYCSQVTHAESRNMDFGKEIDIYLPEYKIGIEYNGIFWHKDKNNSDRRKVDFFADKNIRIVTIAEGNQNIVSGDTIEYVYNSSNKDSLNWAIQRLFELIGLSKVSIDVMKDASEIYNQYITIEKENSLASKYPEVAKQWNYEKNLSLKPEMIMPNSNKKVWWKCHKGHEWQAVVSSRVSSGNGCPYCAGQKVLAGYNDLVTSNPEIACEWHPTKNGDLLPSMVSAGAAKKIWWVCPACKRSYQAAVYHRTKGKGCPYCSGKIIAPGLNDLASLNPNLAAEWNYEKNMGLLPTMVSAGSGKSVWWKCKNGHEWQALIANRVKGRGCPYCSNKKILQGYNDLATINPDLALEWHPTKNGDLLPSMVSSGSHKKVWWLCKKGHEWQAKVENRNAGNGCPQCAKEKLKKKD